MLKILVIEDEYPLLIEVADMLKYEGFEVFMATDGRKGLEKARECVPDLILCDVMMPELDGYALLEALRHDSATVTIPFIFMTAKTERDSQRRGMELGADDYLTKPFRVEELLAAVHTRLEKKAQVEALRWQRFAQRLVVIQDNERQQLSQRLQDDVSQILIGLKLALTTEMKHVPGLIDQALAELEAISLDLRPTALEHLSLLSVLLWLFNRSGLRVRFEHADLEKSFTPELKIAVYRIVQEALMNVATHAKVDEVRVRAWLDDDVISVQVEDRGIGFKLATALESSGGLLGMYARAAALGGLVKILSTPDEGTTVIAKLPVQPIIDSPDDIPLDPSPVQQAQLGDTISVMIADEHEIVRQGLHRLLEPHFTILGEVVAWDEVVGRVIDMQPDVLILSLGVLKSLEVVRHIRAQVPQTRLLLLAPSGAEAFVVEALRHGILGCILKQSSAEELIDAVREVAAGRRYLSSLFSERFLRSYIAGEEPEPLTDREHEVLRLVAEDHTTNEIAEILVISPRTVEKHRANIMHKLNLNSQGELIRYALKHGIISIE